MEAFTLTDTLHNIVNGQVGAETEVNVQGAVEIGRDIRSFFRVICTSRLPTPNEEHCQDNASPEARCEDHERTTV